LIFFLFGVLYQAVRAVSKNRPKPQMLDIAFIQFLATVAALAASEGHVYGSREGTGRIFSLVLSHLKNIISSVV
jgi:hypothetical protein